MVGLERVRLALRERQKVRVRLARQKGLVQLPHLTLEH
jgi:hypothetical protein